jgi:hypothetical protein
MTFVETTRVARAVTPFENLFSNAGAKRFFHEIPNKSAGQFPGGGVRREIFTRQA